MAITGLTRNWVSASIGIAAGSALSGSIITAGRPIVGIQMPPFWTSDSVSFDVTACPGGILYPLYDDSGAQIAIPGTACICVANGNQLEKLASWWGFRIRSGPGAASHIDQASARTFVVFYQG